MRKDYGDVAALATSIQKNGLLNPVTVAVEQDGTFSLLAGGRRLEALKSLNEENVTANVLQREDEHDRKVIELEENLQRKNMTWQEEVTAKKAINELFTAKHGKRVAGPASAGGWSQADTAEFLGESKQNVSLDLRLADAIDHVPALEKCKTKSEAQAVMKKLLKQVTVQAAADKIDKENEAKPEGVDERKENLIKRFIIRDSWEGLQNLQASSFDIVEFDPPYALDFEELRGSASHEVGSKDYKEVSAKDWPQLMTRWLKECYRVLKPTGWLIAWFPIDPSYGFTSELLQALGFSVCKIPALWIKDRGQTSNPRYVLGNAYETFFYARKGADPEIHKSGRLNVYKYSTDYKKHVHPVERPVELIEDVLGTFGRPGAKVLVPFLGSGNTILAAANLSMEPVGFEISKEYKQAFKVRVHESPFGKYKSYEEKL